MGTLTHLAILAIIAITQVCVGAVPAREKAIGIFNIVKFPNDLCISDSTTQNGTCYTSEECSSRNGVASGSCADGYGVCCLISIACGGSSSENCTYVSTTVSPAVAGSSCSYTICPRSTDVTRIRFDLSTFTLAQPGVGSDLDGTPGGAIQTEKASMGRCVQDAFTVTGTMGPYPTICGTNTGQHMIVDTDGSTCVSATFSFGGGTTTRSYNIHVTQYASSNEMGGPSGCLQFFTGDTGTVQSFNYLGTTGARADNAGQHLQSQDYSACIRQNAAKCAICWSPTTTGNVNAIRGSFGLSASAAAALSQGDAGYTNCDTDFVTILGGTPAADAAAGLTAQTGNVVVGTDRFCGRFFGATAAVTDTSVCSRVTPFKLSFTSNAEEEATADGQDMAHLNEVADGAAAMTTAPFGTMGFSLGFAQLGCA